MASGKTTSAKATQAQRVLEYISEFGAITQLEALRDLGVMRLASRISDLKKQGYAIVGTVVTVKNRYGEDTHFAVYKLKEETA